MATFQYRSLTSTVGVTKVSVDVNVKSIILIANDSLTQNIYVALGSDDTDNYICLKPSEQLKNLDVACDTLWIYAGGEGTAYRFVGLTGLRSGE